MLRRYLYTSGLVIVLCAGLFSAPIFVKALGVGCHVPTAQELKELADRGIPPIAQICPADIAALGVGKDFDQWFAELKRVPHCQPNTCHLSCRTRNTGAQVCGPTATRWNSIGCHPNNNTAIFPTVAHGFAAHIELLRRYCGEFGRCTIQRVTAKWAEANNDTYAAFVSRYSGVPYNRVYDPNDIDLMGRIALTMSCFEAGALPYDPAELKRGLVMAAGGPRMPVPSNVGELLNESLRGAVIPNPPGSPNSHPTSWAYPPSSINNGTYTPPTPPANPVPLGAPPPPPSTTPPPGSPTGSSGPAIGMIIAQPSTAQSGRTITVSWTSLRLNDTQPCQIFINDTEFLAQGNEGTRARQAGPATGPQKFTMKCTDQKGSPFEQSATVNVQ